MSLSQTSSSTSPVIRLTPPSQTSASPLNESPAPPNNTPSASPRKFVPKFMKIASDVETKSTSGASVDPLSQNVKCPLATEAPRRVSTVMTLGDSSVTLTPDMMKRLEAATRSFRKNSKGSSDDSKADA